MSTFKERYEERKKKSESQAAPSSFKDRYMARKVESGEFDLETASQEISNRVNTWFTNYNNYVSNYNTRYANRKGTLDDSYVSDSGDWLDTITAQKSNFDKEASAIISYLDTYGDYLGRDWADSVKSALQSASAQQSEILNYATSDKDYWSQYADENEYLGYQSEYKKQKRYEGYQNKYAGSSYEDILAAMNKRIGNEEKEWLSSNKYNLLSTAEDFAENSQYKSTYRGGEKFNPWSGMYTDTGYDDIDYDYINRDEKARSMQGLADVKNNASLLGLDNSERGEMTDDEIATFNYLYATRGSEAAYEYIDHLTSDLNARQRESDEAYWAKYAEEHPVASSVFSVIESPLKGLSYIGQIADYAADGKIDQNEGYNKFSYINSAIRNEVSQKVEEKWGGVGSFAYQTGMSMGDFLFNTAVTGGNSALSLALMGTGAAADTVISSKDRGLNDNQAFLLGTIAGAAEIITEKFSIDALLDATQLGKSAVGYIVKNTLTEGTEEVGSSLINLMADILVAKDKSAWQAAIDAYKANGMSDRAAFWHAVGDQALSLGLDFLGGAISGGLMGGGGAVVGSIGNTLQGKDYKNTYGSDVGSALAGEAVELSPNSKFAKRMQTKAESGKELSNRQVGKLVRQNENAMYENDVATIQKASESRLTELGERGDVKVVAEALAKQEAGEDLTRSESAALKNSKYGQRVANELDADNIKSGEYSSAWAQKIGTDRINAEEYGKLIAEQEAQDQTPKYVTISKEQRQEADGATVSKTEKVENEADAVSEGDHIREVTKKVETPKTERVADDGKTTIKSDGKDVSVKIEEITSAYRGSIKLRLDNDEEVDVNEVNFGNEDVALVYQAAADMTARVDGFNTDTVRVFVNGFNPSAGLTASEYVHGFRDAYRYGAEGAPISELARGAFTSKLTEEQRNRAFHFGRAFGNEKVAQAQSEINARKEKAKETQAAERKEAAYYDGDRKALTERQRASIEVLERVFGGRGMKISFFASYADESGRRVYKNADGDVVPAPNGQYNPDDGSIMIDINAGKGGEGLILNTASHELTHFMKDQSPELYKKYAVFVFEQYGKGENSLDYYVQKRLEIAKKSGRPITEEDAYDEIVADSSEMMLNDILNNKNQENLQKLYAKDKTLFEKIKEFFADLVKRIKAAYRGVDPQSREGKYISEMVDVAEKLQTMWTDALVDAMETYEAIGVTVSDATDSASPQFSERTWTESEYVTERDAAVRELAESLGVTIKKATAYIDDVNSIAKVIANDRARLDYEASSFGSAFVSNVEYGGSFDFTTLCKKRRIYTGTFSEIQKRIGDKVLSPEDILEIRNLMIEGGIEATCGLCYVEGSRANMGKFAKKFIELYKRDNPDGWTPTMVDVNTPDGVEQMRINHPEAYERYEYFWNHFGKLQDSDPALFASQQKPKLYEARKEYKGEVLKNFKDEGAIAKKNRNGGIRMQSFSDFEIVHLIDTMQIIMDMSRVGLAGQAYTKVPEFAEAFGNTGLKINLSLIAKGIDADGNLIFDDREGMPAETAFKLRDKYSDNVGTIIVAFTDDQLRAAMADPRIDFIIPFHRSQWKKSQYGAMGLPKGTKDYTYMQNEKLIKQTYHEYAGRMVKDKASNYMPNEYWDFSKSGKENAEVYLKMCAENNKRPKFYKLLDHDGKGNYSLKADGSTDGYWKLLIDFKMYDNDGVGSPQRAVTPDFSMDEAMTMLEEYKGGHQSYPVAHGVVDKFVEGYNAKSKVKYSERDFASQVDAVLSGADTNNSHLKLMETPALLQKAGLPNLPILMTAKHLKTITSTSAKGKANYHGLDVEIVKKLPEHISDPVMMADSLTREDSIVIITEAIDSENRPVIAAIMLNGKGALDDRYIDANIMTSAYGKDNFQSFLDRIADNNAVIYWDEKKSRDLSVNLGLQLPNIITSLDSGTIIHPAKAFVKSKSKKFSERDYASQEDAVKEFGTTSNFEQAGFVMPDGRMLKLSQYGQTGVKHRIIERIYSDTKGDSAIARFIQEGNVRISAVSPGIEIGSESAPTVSQLNTISRFISNSLAKRGTFYLDITGRTGENIASVAYDEDVSVSDIIYDIKAYYDRGRIPKYSERDPDAISNRELLAASLESAAANDIEKKRLEEYKSKIGKLDAEERKLNTLRAQIKELSFAPGKRDTAKIAELRAEAEKTANRIGIYDKQLLSLEASKPLKEVLKREKHKAYKRAEAEARATLDEYKAKAAKTQEELKTRYQESRKRGVESRRMTEIRNKIKRTVGELNDLLLHGSKNRNVKIGLQEAVAAALEAINMDTIAADERVAKYNELIAKATDADVIESLTQTRDRIQKQGDVLGDKLEAMRKAYRDIREKDKNGDYPDYFKAEAKLIESRIESVIDTVGDTPLRNMTYAQLDAVYDLYKMVLATVRNANAVFMAGKTEDLLTNVNSVMSELSAIPKLPEERSAAVDKMRGFVWNEYTPYYAFSRIGSKTFERFYWEAIKGQDVYARDIDEARDFASEAREKYHYNAWDHDKIHKFKLADGRELSASLKHMMSIYAYSKRPQAGDHMRKGGFFFNDKETFRKKGGVLEMIRDSEASYKIDDNSLIEIVSALSEEQRQYVDDMQAYLTQMGEKGNEVTRILWGIDLFKEKVYFPLKSSKDFIYQANQPVQESSLKNDGMTKETKPGASNPIVLEAFDDVWATHVNRMSQYHAYVLPIENLNKVINYGTWVNTDAVAVSTMLRSRFGSAATEYLNQFIGDMNGVKNAQGATVVFLSGMFSKFKKTAVAGSLSVVIQQPTAILRAQALIDAKYFVGKPDLTRLSEKWETVKKYAPVAIIKDIGGFDAGAGRQTTEWLNADTQRGLKKISGKVDDLTMMGAAWGDQVGWCTIWDAVTRETLSKNPKLAPTSEEFLQLVGERFTEVIVKTQVYDSTLSRSGYMRSKNELTKMMTSFMGEPTVSTNMLCDAVLQAKRGETSKRGAARVIGSVYLATVAASLAKSLIYALRDDDDDESYAEKYLQALGGSIVSDINPLTWLPGVRDVISIFDGWEVERSDMALIQDLKNAIDGLDSEKKSTWRKIEDFAGAIAGIFGVPLKNVMRTAREVYNGFENGLDDISGGKLGKAFLEGVTGKEAGKSEALYDAIIAGDEARLEIYRGDYKSEDAYNSALSKALRENDERITAAAEARYKGDIAEYMRIAKEIIGEGNFSQDNVVAAINAKMAALKKAEESGTDASEEQTADDKVESIYRLDDFYKAACGGDIATAYIVREDMINVAVENGEDREKAEKAFESKLVTYIGEQYKGALIGDSDAKDMLVRYGGKTESEAGSKVRYWAFKLENPEYEDLSESAVNKYYDGYYDKEGNLYGKSAKSYGISLEVYAEYVRGKSGLTKKEDIMYIIDTLPLTKEQKDALYYLNGWSKSTRHEAPWR